MTRVLSYLSIALLLLIPVACATGGSGGSSTSAAPKEKPADSPKSTRQEAPPPAPGEAPLRAEKAEFTTAQKTKMDYAWKAFKDGSPGWPALRDEWVSFGPAATDVLVENLLRAMIAANFRNYPEGYARARYELGLLGDLAVPTLAGVLEHPYVADPRTKKQTPLSTDVVTEVIDLLVVAGPPAVPYLSRLTASEHPSVRRGAVDALGKIKDPEGVPAILYLLKNGEDWIDRMIAARAAGYFDTPATVDGLVKALYDKDDAVIQEAARSLARIGNPAALPALERRRQEARGESNLKVSGACGSAVRLIRERQEKPK